MRFQLVDRILAHEPNIRLSAVKRLALGEEYLADHFPRFPVMPGVLMLHALVEAAAWLWRFSTDYRYSVIALREVKNAKYGTFMEPGKTLEINVEVVKLEEGFAAFKGKGNVEGTGAVSAQFRLAGYNLAEKLKDGSERDQRLTAHLRRHAVILTGNLEGSATIRREQG